RLGLVGLVPVLVRIGHELGKILGRGGQLLVDLHRFALLGLAEVVRPLDDRLDGLGDVRRVGRQGWNDDQEGGEEGDGIAHGRWFPVGLRWYRSRRASGVPEAGSRHRTYGWTVTRPGIIR